MLHSHFSFASEEKSCFTRFLIVSDLISLFRKNCKLNHLQCSKHLLAILLKSLKIKEQFIAITYYYILVKYIEWVRISRFHI